MVRALSSRAFFRYLLALVLVLLIFEGTGARMVLAYEPLAQTGSSPASSASPSLASLPPLGFGAVNQALPAASPNPSRVYFPDYGQFVANPVLRFWRMNGRFNSIGGPMARAFTDAEGNTVQYFQKMALAYYPALANTAFETRPYQIGRIYLEAQPAETRNSFPYGRASTIPNTATSRYFSETGHTLNAGFYNLYKQTGELFMWGFPISEEYSLKLSDGKTYVAQLFERGRMLWTPEFGAVADPNFGTLMAALNKVNVAVELNPEPQPGQAKPPNYSSWAWEHWVDVNLAGQYETFYEGDIPVRTSYVATGKPGYDTPTGSFTINRRVYNERMRGGSIGAEDYYDLENVLYTQYFTYEGHALHYAWWRSTFGVTGSHGCVNQDYNTSEFAWNYLTIGSRVTIHY